MASVKFYLDKRGNNPTKRIYLKLSHQGKAWINYEVVNQVIHTDQWNTNPKRGTPNSPDSVKGTSVEATKLRDHLSNLKYTLEFDVLNTLRSNINRTPTISELVDAFLNKVNQPKVNGDSVIEFIESYFDKNPENVASGTITNYRLQLKRLALYEQKKNIKLTFNTMNRNFYFSFKEFLYDDLNLSKNTIGVCIKNLRMFFSIAIKQNIPISHKDYLSFSAEFESSVNVYLSESEINSVNTIQVKDSLQDSKDAFVINCYTGLRYSDFSALSKHNLVHENGKVFIKVQNTLKTDEQVIIPLHKVVIDILVRRNWNIPVPSSSYTTYKQSIREICKQAGVSTSTEKRITKGRDRVKTIKPKHELVGAHTGRRSFATNAYTAGVPIKLIMSMTGHKTPEEFMKYIGISSEEAAMQASKHEWFS